MALCWSLRLAVLSLLLVRFLSAEPGSTQARRRAAAPAEILQPPAYSRGPSRTRAGAGLRSHTSLQPQTTAEGDRTGPEVVRDAERSGAWSPSQARDNRLTAPRAGKRRGDRKWPQDQSERHKPALKNDKRRHGKGESSRPQAQHTG